MPAGAKPGERRGGRQKGTPNKNTSFLRDIAREYTEEAVQVLVDAMKNGETFDIRAKAADKLLDRGWGRPAQSHEHTGAEGGPIETKISLSFE